MKLLVTGGAGFIGANFIIYWLKHHPKDEILNLDKLTYAGNLENLIEVEGHPRYAFVKGDITNPDLVQKTMQGIDIVVNFAAESHVDRSIMDPSIFVTTNVLGTQILLEAAVKCRIKRFHHISTDEVFGALKLNDAQKFSERSPYNPKSPYAASKAGSDHIVRAYYHTFGLPITITNSSNNYGPFQHPEKLIPLTITNLLEGKKVPVYGDGLHVRDWLYVTDNCRAIDTVITHGKVGETYCVGGLTQDISNNEIVSKILKLMGCQKTEIEFIKDRPGHDRRYAIDWTKIKTELGWEPTHGFDTHLIKTIEWYKSNRDWWKHVKNGEYQKYYKRQYSK